MSSFEWMELQTLTSDITAARARLAAARANKDARLIGMLEQEITAAEDRRVRLLSNITDQLSGDTGQAASAAARPAGEIATVAGEEAPSLVPETAAEAAQGAPPAVLAPSAVAWERLSQGDIERAMETLRTRHAEILARHAAELQGWEADRVQVEALNAAIDAFTRRFAAASGRGAVVQLDEEREMRAQNRA